MSLTQALLYTFLFTSLADAAVKNALLRTKFDVSKSTHDSYYMSRRSTNGAVLPPVNTTYFFDQLIDHGNPSLGTFQQRYWMNWQYYHPGGPIILVNPGEGNAEASLGFLTNETLTDSIARENNGATVLLEHRFFGDSIPYSTPCPQDLAFLTVQQAIDDHVYFAQNVDLPMPGGDDAKPEKTKWVLVGLSYAGALMSWTMVNRPGVFHAGYVSSAVVETMTDYYSYFTIIREYMPQNCSSDVQAVIAYLDQMYAENNTVALQDLKQAFGLGNLSHIEDFAAALQYNLYEWQELSPDSGPGTIFFQFCDALEVKDGASAPASGWGLQNAISSWGSFWNDTYYNYFCGDTDAETCLGTYDTSQSVCVDDSRSWFWLVCNQFGWYRDGPPLGQPAIASRIIQSSYFERQCVDMFPEAFPSPRPPSVDEVNDMYTGWNINVDRLFFANGLRDPWRGVTVSADGLNKPNTTLQPIYESDGFHASDILIQNGLVDPTVYTVQMAILEHMKIWLA